MNEGLLKLSKRREKLQEALEENKSAGGLHRLLTDLYPDSAHFVYELLQNAEDAGAQHAEFLLKDTGMLFCHDGKRAFTLSDVDAITSIGFNEGKQQNESSIGEFGVGFKAVFAYTSNPEIHSGDYHFRIKDYFIPVTDGVSGEFLAHDSTEGWTEFWLPFDNHSKSQEAAFEESRRGIEQLDETALLFLQNIKSITCRAYRSDWAFYKRLHLFEDGDNVVRTVLDGPDGSAAEVKKYLRYSEDIEVTSSRGKKKRLPIAVAYELQPDDNGIERIVPAAPGRVFVYFPAEKEYSGLKFHINGPFSSTVARDSIRDCPENRCLMDKIACLVSRSLVEIKKKGLLSVSFYAVLPNEFDDLTDFYSVIKDKVDALFWDRALLVAKNGRYVRAADALLGTADFAELLDKEMLELLSLSGKVWLRSPGLPSSREHQFVHGLHVSRFDETNFIRLMGSLIKTPLGRDKLSKSLHGRDLSWMRLLYRTVALSKDEFAVRISNLPFAKRWDERRLLITFDQNWRKVAFVYLSDGTLALPSKAFMLPEGLKPDGIDAPLVHAKIMSSSSKRFGSDRMRRFLIESGVQEYSFEVELDKISSRYQWLKPKLEDRSWSEQYLSDIRSLIAAYRRGEKSVVSQRKLFIGISPNGEVDFFAPNRLYIGDRYGNKGGDEVARFACSPVLSGWYLEVLGQTYRKSLVELLTACDAHLKLEIVACDVSDNPQYEKLLIGQGKESAKKVSSDWTIPGLPDSLNGVSETMAKTIWQLLVKHGDDQSVRYATYRANARSETNRVDSSLIYHLKNYSWVPSISGDLCCPKDMEFNRVAKRFRNLGGGPLIEALEFGSQLTAQAQNEKKLEEFAGKLGRAVISLEDYAEFQKLKAEKEKAQKRAEKSATSKQQVASVSKLFANEERVQVEHVDLQFEGEGSVPNPERRERRLAQRIQDSQPSERRYSVRASESDSRDASEHDTLEQWYHGHCQICGTRIIKADGGVYFEAVNIVSTSRIEHEKLRGLEYCWNSMCLCPNCAAKYKYGAKSIEGMPRQIGDATIEKNSDRRIEVEIELAGKRETVSFVPKHLLAVKVGLRELGRNGS